MAEVPQEIDKPADARPTISIGAWCNRQKPLVGIGGFLVTLCACGCLAQTEDVIRLARIHADCPT
jgi:hypothetical protein